MKIKLKLNTKIKSSKGVFNKGTVIELEADINKQPLDSFWRRCLKEASIDNSVEIITESKIKKVKK